MERAFEFLVEIAQALHLLGIDSRSPTGAFIPLSKSELKRWMERGCFEVNGKLMKDWENDVVDYPIQSFIIFPTNKKRRCTVV